MKKIILFETFMSIQEISWNKEDNKDEQLLKNKYHGMIELKYEWEDKD